MAATNVISMEAARRRIVKNRKAKAKGRHGLSSRAKRWLAGTSTSTRGTVLMVAMLAVLMVGVIAAGVTTASANNLEGTVAADTLP